MNLRFTYLLTYLDIKWVWCSGCGSHNTETDEAIHSSCRGFSWTSMVEFAPLPWLIRQSGVYSVAIYEILMSKLWLCDTPWRHFYCSDIEALCDYATTPCPQKKHVTTFSTITLTISVRLHQFLAQLVVSLWVIQSWFHFPPHLSSATTLFWEITEHKK